MKITILVSEFGISEQKYEYFQTGMSENGTIHITMIKKTGSVIYFFLEKGGLSYTWQR